MPDRTVVREYLDEAGHSPFARWFDNLDAVAAAKVSKALYRMERGNFSNVEGVGEGVFEYKIRPGVSHLFRQGRPDAGDSPGREQQEAPVGGHRCRKAGVASLQTRQDWQERYTVMALTRDFRETIQARMARDPAFRDALFIEALNAHLSGDTDTGKAMLRDLVNATVGFEQLAVAMQKPSKTRLLQSCLGHKENIMEINGRSWKVAET